MGMLLTASFVILLAMGIPIAFVLGLITMVHIVATGNFSYLSIVPNRIFGGLDSFVMLAVPFFILAGAIMNAGGASQRLVAFAAALLGHLRGGLALVSVATSMFFAGISGAATADAAAIGMVMIRAMERAGFGRAYSAALIATASLMGPIIPPSIILVLYGVVAEVSIASLFLAGVIPGLLIGFVLVALTVWKAKKANVPLEPRATRREIAGAFFPALPALLLPIIIIGGIVFGVATPTEAAALAVVLALLLGVFVYRELTIKDLPKVFGEAALISGAVLLIIGMASGFSWVLTAERIPQAISEWLLAITTDPIYLLLLINGLLLVVGCFLEGAAALIILTPILLPAVVEVGISPIQFGIIMSLNLVIGFITPPIGICLFVMCSVAKVSMEELIRAVWPMLLAMIGVLLLVTYVPHLTMFLPNLFYK